MPLNWVLMDRCSLSVWRKNILEGIYYNIDDTLCVKSQNLYLNSLFSLVTVIAIHLPQIVNNHTRV
jgi:hypothetical protein